MYDDNKQQSDNRLGSTAHAGGIRASAGRRQTKKRIENRYIEVKENEKKIDDNNNNNNEITTYAYLYIYIGRYVTNDDFAGEQWCIVCARVYVRSIIFAYL